MPDPIPAKQYFRRAGRAYVAFGVVVAIVGAVAAPDTLGRVLAAIMTAVLLLRGGLFWRRGRSVSDRAVVREQVSGRRVVCTVEEPE